MQMQILGTMLGDVTEASADFAMTTGYSKKAAT
jgi:hypothetical protein